jgi:hypothetical protein
MAKLKLSELPALTSRTNSDLLYVVQNGASKQITAANLLANIFVAGENITIESNGMISASVDLTGVLGNTTIVPEGANLYFTDARALAAVIDNINTSNVAEGANLYFTNARATAAVRDNVSTSNITEGSNLYFTNARAVAALTSTIEGLTTSNIVEGSNLYFSNTRAVEAFTGGKFIEIEANGTISANVNLEDFSTDNLREGNNYLYFSNERAITALTAGPGIIISANGMI